jgi:hypothetical protein
MLRFSTRFLKTPTLSLIFAALAFAAAGARAQQGGDSADKDAPFHEYKGVRLGMTLAEARKALGTPTDKGDKQDFFSFNDKESCQVYYDDSSKVFAVSVTYLGEKNVPAPKSVIGTDIEAKQDGSLYKMIRFPKAGYWVSYTRTAGADPMTIIAIQKLQP